MSNKRIHQSINLPDLWTQTLARSTKEKATLAFNLQLFPRQFINEVLLIRSLLPFPESLSLWPMSVLVELLPTIVMEESSLTRIWLWIIFLKHSSWRNACQYFCISVTTLLLYFYLLDSLLAFCTFSIWLSICNLLFSLLFAHPLDVVFVI